MGADEEDGAFRGPLFELSERIIGVFFGVLNELGPGFLECVYRRAMCISLVEAGLQVQEEAPIEVWYHGRSVGIFKADIVVNGLVILELKTCEEVKKEFEAQLLHYLRATQIEVGMVLAFGSRGRFRRLSLTNDRKRGIQEQERGSKG